MRHVASGLRRAGSHPTWKCTDRGKPPVQAQARAPAPGYLKPEEGLGARRRNAAMNERVEPAALANGRPLAPREPAAITLPADHPKVAWGRVGVLLMNLGTPEGTTYWPMRRYLKEFLSDRRVIEVPRLIWWPLLNLIILTKRPGPKGRDYASVWNNALNEGPLKTITRGQSRAPPGGHGRFGRGRLGDALRQARGRRPDPGAARPGLRPHPAGAALSAIRRRHLGHRLRPGVPRPDGHALAADRARLAALPRRSGLHRRHGRFDPRGSGQARFRAGGDPHLVPRRAAELPAQGRSLPLPVPQDRPADPRGAGPVAGHDAR